MKCVLQILGLSCAALFLSGCYGPYEPTDAKGRADCYRAEFGTLPPEEVTHLQAKQLIIGDAARAWLRFEATPALVDSLRQGFTLSNSQTFYEHSGGSNIPAWWVPKSDQLIKFYEASDWDKNFSSSFAVMAHDAEKHVVYFCHDAFD